MKNIAIFIFFIFISGFLTTDAFSVNNSSAPEINLPGSVEVENKNDITLYILSELLGDSFKEIAGNPAETDTKGFSELLVGVLGVLNMLSMVYVGASVIYLWVIFAATTAHEGERLGGGVYDSLWVPIRQASAFVLAVPVLNGLSVMQILIIACISMSINFANIVWNAAGNYVIKNANVGLIESSTPSVTVDLYHALPSMFYDAVEQILAIDDLTKNKKDHIFPESARSTEDEQVITGGFIVNPTSYGIPSSSMSSSYDPLLIFLNYKKGEAKVKVRQTTNMSSDSTGTILITLPNSDNGVISQNSADLLKQQIAQIRIKYICKLYGEVFKAATVYLHSRATSATGKSGCAIPLNGEEKCLPAETADEAIEELLSQVVVIDNAMSAEINAAIQGLMNNYDKKQIGEMLAKSIDMEGVENYPNAAGLSEGTSKYGWVSAGTFNLSLGLLQKEYNYAIESSLQAIPSEKYTKNKDYLVRNKLMLQKYPVNLSNKDQALKNADNYFDSIAMQNNNYSSIFLRSSENNDGEVDKGMNAIQKTIMNTFINDNDKMQGRYGGLTGTILTELGTYDPVVVMQNFGDKLFNSLSFTNWKLMIAAVGSTFTLGSSFTIMAILLLVALACFFSYIAPIIPFLFWMQALVSWLFMVVEAMVAAPFWVCTHVMPEGKGVAGDHARKGYMLLLELMTRPVLLVVGAVFAVAICQTVGWFVNQLLGNWFGTVANSFLTIGFFGDLMYTILLLSLIYYIYYTVFTKGVIYMPEKVLAWCGAGSGMGLQGGERTLRNTLLAGGALSVAQSSGTIKGLADSGTEIMKNTYASAKSAGKSYKKYKLANKSGTLGDGNQQDQNMPYKNEPIPMISRKGAVSSDANGIENDGNKPVIDMDSLKNAGQNKPLSGNSANMDLNADSKIQVNTEFGSLTNTINSDLKQVLNSFAEKPGEHYAHLNDDIKKLMLNVEHGSISNNTINEIDSIINRTKLLDTDVAIQAVDSLENVRHNISAVIENRIQNNGSNSFIDSGSTANSKVFVNSETSSGIASNSGGNNLFLNNQTRSNDRIGV